MDGAINDAAVAKKNAGNTDHLSSLIFEKQPSSASFGQHPIEPQTGSFQLPKIDFVISHGQQETSYLADGNVFMHQTDKKVDPDCSNGVRSADGSEQRFDKTGLCKLTGNVHWGKTIDGVMQIDIGGTIKIGLDKNWQLVNVQGEHTSYKASNELKHSPESSLAAGSVLEHAKAAEHNSAQVAQPGHAHVAGAAQAESTEIQKIAADKTEEHKSDFHKSEAHKSEPHRAVTLHKTSDTHLKKSSQAATAAKTEYDLNGIY